MKSSHVLAIALTLGLTHVPARADDAGDRALAAVETAMNKARTLYFEYEAVTAETGKAEKKVALNVRIKGDKRLTEFTAPADLKGAKVLILSSSEMYVYLPAFGKVRRISSTAESAFGMAFSQTDLATHNYSGLYQAAQTSSSDKEVKLTLTPKSGQIPDYARIEVTIAKDRNVPTELRYFNGAGKAMKTETRSGYSCDGDVCTPGTLKMVDHTRGLTTTVTRKKVKVNEAISDDTFSRRSLEK